MAIKNFKIDWEGKKEIIEYEDELTFGELEAILNASINLDDIQKPKVNIPQYRMAVITKVIKKAPFTIGDATTFRKLKANVAKQVISGVMRDYPLMKFLEDWLATFTGYMDMIESSTQSTIPSPNNSDGIKEQLTDNQ